LAPGKGAQIETDLRVGFTPKFHQKTKQAVKRHERPKDRSAIKVLLVEPSQDKKKYGALEQSFVKL